jgi:hypothetical protein
MRLAAIGLMLSVALVACSGSDAPAPSSPSATEPSSPAPVASPSASPSGAGFCTDRAVLGEVYRTVREGTVGYRTVAAFVASAGKLMKANVDSAPTDLGARKLRSLVFYLNTLRLAILGSVENYPEDFAVMQFTNGLPSRVQGISDEFDCPA